MSIAIGLSALVPGVHGPGNQQLAALPDSLAVVR